MWTARDFLKILGIQGLPLFNPLYEENNKTISKGTENKNINSWNPTAKQNTPLFEFRDDIVKYKIYNPFDWKIKRVNTAITNGENGKTLTEIVDKFREGNNIKDSSCDFSLLNERMANITDGNGKVIKSFF